MTMARSTRMLLIAPAIIYLAALTQAPFILTLWYSFQKWILTSPELGVSFVGFENFAYTLFQDTTFRAAVINLVLITAGIVVMSLIFGMVLALLLHRKFPGQGIARSLAIAPFFVMPTVNAVVWKNLLLNPVFGFVSYFTTHVGLPRIDILAQFPKTGIITMAVWQWTPFMMLILLAGLQSVPDEIREAAEVDGANPWEEFRYITFPLLGSFVQLSVLLATIYVLQLFGEIFVATQGGPGSATTTLPYYVYETISQGNDVGTSSAQGVCAVIIASIIATFLLRLLARTFEVSKA
jgi:sorbitol/mannitol transport system permease protein